jgi:hypothetical protein
MKPSNEAAVRAVIRPATWLWLMGAALMAQSLAGAGGDAAAASVAVLEYRETSEVLGSQNVEVKLERVPFKKEPAVAKKEVYRGLLQLGQPPEPPIAFVWDKRQRQLYLDLNRNGDLTDDAKGAFVSSGDAGFPTFTNVVLSRVTANGTHPARVQLDFRFNQRGSVRVSAGLCSYWEARITVGGREWQFGLLENFLGGKGTVAPNYLLLRPWTERERPFNLTSSSPDFTDYCTNLFFGNQAYTLDCRYDSSGPAPRYQVTFKEQAVPLGEVKVSGAFLHRLILKQDKGYVALLDQPAGSQRIPAGKYTLEELWLRQGNTEALRLKAGKIIVDPQQPASLVAGGPLTNSVKVFSRGYDLSLQYELLGADGAAYTLPRPDRSHPPQFAIFQGTNRLAADKFSYG